MSYVSPTTAKSYFEQGDKPTQAQFTDLIDSTHLEIVNIAEIYGIVEGDSSAATATANVTAFQNAFNSVTEAVQYQQTKALYLPSGDYYIDAPVLPKSSTLLFGPGVMHGTTPTEEIIKLSGVNDIVIDGLGFTHDVTPGDYVSGWEPAVARNDGDVDCNRITVRNCMFYKTANQGVRSQGGTFWHVYNNRFFEITTVGIYIADTEHIKINDNVIYQTGDDGMQMAVGADNYIISGNLVIEAGVVLGQSGVSGSGIRVTGINGAVTGNTIIKATLTAIAVTNNFNRPNDPVPSNITISGNSIFEVTDIEGDTAVGGITLHNVGDILIANNVIDVNKDPTVAGNSKYAGVRIYTTAQNPANLNKRILIKNNIIKNCFDGVLVLNDDVTHIEVDGNTFDTYKIGFDIESTLTIANLAIRNNYYYNGDSTPILNIGTGTSAEITALVVENNKIVSGNGTSSAINFQSKTVSKCRMRGNDFGGQPPYANDSNVANFVFDGDEQQKLTNEGTATVSAGNTNVSVSHGLINRGGGGLTPNVQDITITPMTAVGSANTWWVDTIGSSTFNFNITSSAATNVSFGWKVQALTNQRIAD
jgi:hypothetical protein